MSKFLFTRKQILEYVWWSYHVILPKGLINELYQNYIIEEGCIDDNGHWQYYSEQDAWENIRMNIEDYVNIKQSLEECEVP